MKNINWLVIVMLINFSQSSNTNDYLWIDYDSKMPVKVQNQDTFAVNIPCQTRIGDCKAVYSIVPPGWTGKEDGSLIIPRSAAKGYGVYAIKATLKNIFDEKLQADLVCTIDNGVFSVSNKNQFFKSNGIDQKSSTSKLFDINNLLSEKKYDLQGFPTVKQLQSLIKTGNIYTMSEKMKQISQKYAPCQPRINYLNQALIFLLQKMSETDKILKNYDQTVSNTKERINTLEQQRIRMRKQLNNDKSLTDIKNSIKRLNVSREEVQANLDKFSYLADRYLNSMYRSNVDETETNQALQIAQLQEQMKAVQKIIEEGMKKKQNLEQQIKVKRSKISKPVVTPKQKQIQLMGIYESKYREYADKVIEYKMQLRSIEQQIRTLTGRESMKNAELVATEERIKEQKKRLAEIQTPTAIKAQEEQANINQIIKLSANNVKSKISFLNSSRCAY